MTAPAPSSPSAFEKYLATRLRAPRVRAGYEDESAIQHAIDRLVGFRKILRLSQKEVAARMGVKQPTVSGFETEMSDPKLSTLQRYARAVEARIEVTVKWDAECDWIAAPKASSPPAYEVRVVRQDASMGEASPNVGVWAAAASSKRNDFCLTA